MPVLDVQNIYSGSVLLANGSSTWTGQALAAGTTLSTNVVDHNPSRDPFGNNQNVQAGLGEPIAVVLEVLVAPGDTSGGASYTVNLLTDVNANLVTTPRTLASLVIPNATVAGTFFVGVIPPTQNFERFSGLQYVLVNGTGAATLTVVAFLVPINFIQNWLPYESGWVIENS